MPRPGPTDTIPALLTKGEAVLVPEVAEAVGRHNIEAANKQAVAKRKGIVPLEGYACGASKVQGYAIGTPDVQQNNSAVQTSVKAPIQSTKPNTLNSATGITTVGGGNNGQSIANQYTKLAPPMVGMPGVGTGPSDNNLAKQNLFARTAMDSAARLGKSGNMDAATGIMQDLNKAKPITQLGFSQPAEIDIGASKFTALADENGIQGYDEGTSSVKPAKEPKFKPGVSSFTPTAEEASPGKFPAVEAPAGAGKAPARTNILRGEPKFKPGVSDFAPSDAALKEANKTYLTEPPVKQVVPAKPARQVGGKSAVGEFTPTAEEIAGQRYNPVEGKAGGLGGLPQAEKAIQQGLYEKTLGVPQTGPFSKVPPRPTIEAGKNLVPVTHKGIVPVGSSVYTQPEPTPQQFRPGAGGAPTGEYTANFLMGGKGPAAPKAQGYSAEELANMERVKAANQGRVAAARMGLGATGTAVAEAAPVVAEEPVQPATAAAKPSVKQQVGKFTGIVPLALSAYPKAKEELSKEGAFDITKPQTVAGAKQGVADYMAGQKAALEEPSETAKAYKSAREMGYGVAPAAGAGVIAGAAELAKPVIKGATELGNDLFGSPEAAPATPAKVATPAAKPQKQPTQAEAEPEQAFAPKASENGQYRVDLDDKGQFIQSANKAGMERVAKGLRERGGIVKAAQRPAGAVSDFWVNQGYPGGAAQYQAQKEQKALENLALNGGGTGNMSVSEFRRANARQKAAQGILADRERINAQREHLASEDKKSAASMAATAAEREYQHRKDVKEAEQKQAEYEQRERLAGEKPVKIGEDIMPTKDVPAYQARKAREAKIATLTDYVKKNSGLFSGSAEDALIEGLIQQGDQEGTELAELKAYLNVAKPEHKKQIEAEIQKRTAPYRSALNG